MCHDIGIMVGMRHIRILGEEAPNKRPAVVVDKGVSWPRWLRLLWPPNVPMTDLRDPM